MQSIANKPHALPTPITLLQNLYTAVLWLDKDLTIQWVNSQTEQLFCGSHSRLIGCNIVDILYPTKNAANSSDEDDDNCDSQTEDLEDEFNLSQFSDDVIKQKLYFKFLHALSYQQPFIEYNRHIKGVVQPLYVNYSVTPVEQSGQHFFLVELWQKNRQNRIKNEYRQQEQHMVAREMLRSVAHEVKNPLAGIRGAAQLLNKHTQKSIEKSLKNDNQNESIETNNTKSDLNSKLKNKHLTLVDTNKLTTYSNIVISETDRLTSLIEQLLGSNKLPNWQKINVHEPLEHVLSLTNTKHPNLIIKRDYDLSLPEHTADKNQLIQVFLNIVNNACDAMYEARLIPQNFNDDTDKLSNKDLKEPTLEVSTRIEHQHTIGKVFYRQVLRVNITDNGPGIPPHLMHRLFFPMVSGRANGTGLGLSIVQEIIHRHHGTIEVSSEFGKTTFSIYLPFEQKND